MKAAGGHFLSSSVSAAAKEYWINYMFHSQLVHINKRTKQALAPCMLLGPLFIDVCLVSQRGERGVGGKQLWQCLMPC